jgi:heme oxygenase (mycobilin-producing)
MSVVKINAIEVPEGSGQELERRFAARLGAVDKAPGFLGFELLRPVAGENRYFVYTRWENEEAFQAWSSGSGIQAHSGERSKPVGTGSALLEFEVVQSAAPAAADQ